MSWVVLALCQSKRLIFPVFQARLPINRLQLFHIPTVYVYLSDIREEAGSWCALLKTDTPHLQLLSLFYVGEEDVGQMLPDISPEQANIDCIDYPFDGDHLLKVAVGAKF